MRKVWVTGTAGVMAVLVAYASITQIRGDVPEVVAATVVSVDRDSGRISLPLDEYSLSIKEYRQVNLAVNLLLSACMANRGFRLEVVDRVDEPMPSDRRYGIWNAREASANGYALPPATVAEQQEQAINGRSMSRDESIAFARCGREPRIRALAVAPPLAQRLGRSSYGAALDSAEGRSLIAEWRECLAVHGIVGAEQVWFPTGALPTGTAISRETAVVDVDCKTSTHLVERMAALEGQLQTELIETNANELAAERKRIRATIGRASQINADRDRR